MTPSLTKPVPLTPTEAFLRACRYEGRHLAALRSTWILLSVVTVLSLLTGLTVILDLDGPEAVQASTAADAITWTPLATQVPALCFFMLVLGTGPVSNDLVTGAARTTWLAVNGRGTAYAAKCAVGVSIGCSVAAASVIIGALSYATALSLTGSAQPPWIAVLPAAARFIVWMGCWALWCTATVSLLRSRVLPVILLLLWPLIAERLVGALLGHLPGLDGIGNWLPFAVGRAMLTDASAYTGDDQSFTQTLIGSHLPTPTATTLFCLYTAAITAAGLASYSRRDPNSS
ncbi:hypothetical protein ACIPRL_35970 [Streptomyces sp. NPDC090085]|uniref:hypothetical protein n=1 Tax=Streptomyces sp. NPDC090085 TaxID=3365943 RepID=UPI0038082499